MRAACELFPGQLEPLSIRAFPLYDQDLEAEAFPAAVREVQARLANTHGLIVVSPEYNRSMSGVMKNAIDWISRGAGGYPRVLEDKAIALAGASPGRFGTVSAQSAWLPVFSSLGAVSWGRSPLLAGGAGSSFDDQGKLLDEALRERLREWVAGFISFSQS
jgi:NAD(P)H-dependent FMN reductase